jgi:hypothetical protein
VLVKLSSRCSAESMISFILFSAAATCAWRKSRDFPICAARRSVGVRDLGFLGASFVGLEDVFVGGAGVAS